MFKLLFSSKGEIDRLDYFGGLCLSVLLFLASFYFFDRFYYPFNEWNFFINSLVLLFWIYNLTKKRVNQIPYKFYYVLFYMNIFLPLGILSYLMLILTNVIKKAHPMLNLVSMFYFILVNVLLFICLFIKKKK